MIKIKNYKEVVQKIKPHLEEYLESQGVHINKNNFRCFASQHKDEHTSAGLTKDRQAFKCQGCGIKGDILKAYTILENKDITGQKFFYAVKELADRFGVLYELEQDYPNKIKDKEYIYRDDFGDEAYKIVRYYKKDSKGNIVLKSNGKKAKEFIAYNKCDEGWKSGISSDGKRYIYNLVDVQNAIKQEREVYFFEGEKCADIVKEQFNLVSTTIAFGANSWTSPYKEQYIEQLKNSNLILIPDNDEAGFELMKSVAGDLKDKAKSIKIINLNEDIELPKKGDIEEWIQLGGTAERLIKLKNEAKDLVYDAEVVKSIKKEKTCNWIITDEKGKRKVIPGLLARHIINKNNFMYCNSNFYKYEEGVYKECSFTDIQSIIKEEIGDELSNMSLIKNISGLIEIEKSIIKNINDLDKNLNIINVRNGLYNAKTKEFKKHDSQYLSTIQLNVDYNPNARGETFKKFLDDMLPKQEQQLLQEMAGYSMSLYNNAKKFFVLQGVRDTGKTTFLNSIANVIGKKYISNINLQEITNRFNKAELFGKLANISSDLSDEGLSDTGFIKALIGQDIVQAEKKGKDPFTFVNKATLIFPCNHLPRNYGDNTDDFLNKMIIIKFNRQLNGNEIDPMFSEKLQNEKDYVFLWAMEGLRRLIDNDFKFTETFESKMLVKQYKISSNNVLEFIQSLCEIGEGLEVGSVELYNRYTSYCSQNNYKAVSRNKFKEEINREYGNKIISKQITNKRINGFVGIALKQAI